MTGVIREKQGESDFFGAFLGAMAKEHRLFYESHWRGERESIGPVYAPFARTLEQEIPRIAAPLFATLELELRPCPAMCHAARALPTDSRSIKVATGVPRDAREQTSALFQILHELTHLATDRILGTRVAVSERDTHIESHGYRVHWLLEQAVLAADYQLVRRHRPALLEPYVSWCAAWVLPRAGPDPVALLRTRAEQAGVNKPSSQWQALSRVAPTSRLQAVEAALEDFLLVPDPALPAIEATLAGRSSRDDRTAGR
jgi:hypothetical protein